MNDKYNVTIANIGNSTNLTNGDKIKAVTSAKKLSLSVDLVGVNTQQLGQTQGFNLIYSVSILRKLYDNEKYLYFDNELYEIKSLTKSKTANMMLLNVQVLNNEEIKNAIEVWNGNN